MPGHTLLTVPCRVPVDGAPAAHSGDQIHTPLCLALSTPVPLPMGTAAPGCFQELCFLGGTRVTCHWGSLVHSRTSPNQGARSPPFGGKAQHDLYKRRGRRRERERGLSSLSNFSAVGLEVQPLTAHFCIIGEHT